MYRHVGILLITIVVGLGASGTTARADGSPCGFDLFVLSNGQAQDLTNTPFGCEFRPEWSPSRKQVVYNFFDDNGSDLRVADVASGVGTVLVGSDNGNNPSWSPNDQLIAFDRLFVGDPRVYVLPPSGGTRLPIVSDAIDVDWAPNSQRLAFVRPSDGSIHTVDLAGGDETLVAPPGVQLGCLALECGLSWSPDGQFIAYSDGSDIWTVRVSVDGRPLAGPQLVSAGGPFYQTQLTWTGDSKAIVFNSNRAGDGGSALWSVPAVGGTPQRIAGTTSFFNFDPNVARGGGAIVYAASTS